MADNPCAGCGKPMGYGDYEEAEGKEYHVECFVCGYCRKPFDNGEYFKHNDLLVHKDCIKVNAVVRDPENHGDVCAECGKIIPFGTELFKVSDPNADSSKPVRFYHQACFKCAECNKPIGSLKHVISHGKPVHEGCAHAVTTKTSAGEVNEFVEDLKCDRCGEVIRGQRKVVPDFGTFHLTCFRCCACGLGITAQFFKDPATGKARCHRCPP